MAYSVEILADSLNPVGDRLTTFLIQYPRMIHSELMTHRDFSKSAASSRAIPIQKMLAMVIKDPVMPVWWGKNQSGMQAKEELSGWRLAVARFLWLKARYLAVAIVWLAWKAGLHKQIANRMLEPWLWITVICTGTNYEHMFMLRDHPDAQPEFRHLAIMMRRAYNSSYPKQLLAGDWHMPYILDDEQRLFTSVKLQLSVARCARTSYLNHGSGKVDIVKDMDRHHELKSSGHWTPFEHQAEALATSERHGNLVGFKQYRKTFKSEYYVQKPYAGLAAA